MTFRCAAQTISVTGVSNSMAGGADLLIIITKAWRRLHRTASGLFIALVIQMPVVTAMARSSRGDAIGPRGPLALPLKVRAAPFKVPWRCPSRSEVRHPSRLQGTNYDTKIVKFLGPSHQNYLHHIQNMRFRR